MNLPSSCTNNTHTSVSSTVIYCRCCCCCCCCCCCFKLVAMKRISIHQKRGCTLVIYKAAVQILTKHMCSALLFVVVLFCSVLFCSVMFCYVMFCSVMFCSVMFCYGIHTLNHRLHDCTCCCCCCFVLSG
jgi:hypothetical protein